MDLKSPIVSLFQYNAAQEGNEITFTAGGGRGARQERVGERAFPPKGTSPRFALRGRRWVRSEVGLRDGSLNNGDRNHTDTEHSSTPPRLFREPAGLVVLT